MDKNILIVPIGRIEPRVLEMLQNGLRSIFNRETSTVSAQEEPEYAHNKQRDQYSADMILIRLSAHPESRYNERTIGVVDHDLFVNNLKFVFGTASGLHALFSPTRLRQEFYGFPADENLFESRLLTEAVHELGHTYGLGHCSDEHCVMYFSNRLSDTDRKGYKFCEACRRGLF
jgi:archaemetzincin